ncbi:carbohydrate ABC transporter permease [Paenibacillus sp. GXUN7292]|uniref:carbohydrate ABC transporter permease n=1 Tax=Paenibacillus sp. GXUN7292 TaxID=3422499 RepID=UPI003D7DD717
MYHKTPSYKVFYAFNIALLSVLAILCILPLINVLAISFSSRYAIDSNLVTLWPVEFTWEAYLKTLQNDHFARAMGITLERTLLGTALSMLFTIITAFPLSKPDMVFKGRTIYAWVFLFTMLFSGGLIPSYILIQELGLMNSIWALVLPPINIFNILLLLNFFRGIPKELEEAAFIDGAGYFRSLVNVYVPLSLPALTTLSLFFMVGHWNSWFDGMLYMTDMKQWPLSTLMRTIVVELDFTKITMDPAEMRLLSERSVKGAQIFISILPIILVYPFLQKYFVKGLVMGSMKE